ncbi:hypothetical protein D3C85_1032400 [compost metagenome]
MLAVLMMGVLSSCFLSMAVSSFFSVPFRIKVIFTFSPGRFRIMISCNLDEVFVSISSILIMTSFALTPANFAAPVTETLST